MRWALKVGAQLRNTECCAGFTLDAQLASKTFSTLSAWSDEQAMNSFVRSGAHAAMLSDMAGRLGKAIFVGSAGTAADLPLRWPAARDRLAEEEGN